MNTEAIRERFSGEFRPFSILTSDGRKYTVRHPYSMMLGPRALMVLGRAGQVVSLDPLHIVALKELAPRANGRAKG